MPLSEWNDYRIRDKANLFFVYSVFILVDTANIISNVFALLRNILISTFNLIKDYHTCDFNRLNRILTANVSNVIKRTIDVRLFICLPYE